MPMILFLVLIGTAAGLIAARIMRVQAGFLTVATIGVAGTLLGWMVLTLSGWLLIPVAAIAGAAGLLWLWRGSR